MDTSEKTSLTIIHVNPAVYGDHESVITVFSVDNDEMAKARFKKFTAAELLDHIALIHAKYPHAKVQINPVGIGSAIADEWRRRAEMAA